MATLVFGTIAVLFIAFLYFVVFEGLAVIFTDPNKIQNELNETRAAIEQLKKQRDEILKKYEN